MKATAKLHDIMGQSLWLDSITRAMLKDGTLQRYIDEFSVTGLTSNPTIFDSAIRNTNDYDDDIRKNSQQGLSGEAIFVELELNDLRQAADLFHPAHDRTCGVDGWVSLEVSPLLAHDTAASVASAKELHHRARRPNLYIKIPGTPEGVPAIEEALFAGVPINVTLLLSRDQYLASAEAWMRAMERRIEAGLRPDVPSVASLFISRWDVAAGDRAPAEKRNRLGIAIGQQTYKAYRELLDSPRCQRLMNAGARPQRLLFGSTGVKDPKADELLYVESLAAPLTVNTIPEKTLKALAGRQKPIEPMRADGSDSEQVLNAFSRAGIDLEALGTQLQEEGAKAFVRSWNDLMDCIASKSEALAKAR